MKPAVFFDRDGVLNVEKNYLYKTEDFVWQPGAREAIQLLNGLGYFVFVVTNQSGVARGFYTEADVKLLHDFMQQQLAECGAKVDAFYYCPHHPAATVQEYKLNCTCRKPESGMLLQAFAEYPVDKQKSFLIGDKQSDLQAAENAGIKGYLYETGDLRQFVSVLLENAGA